MSAKKWLTLPEGTKVRMNRDFLDFKKWDIVTRVKIQWDDFESVRFDWDGIWEYLEDDQWELIEEPKEEPRLPKQGDKVQVGDSDGYWDSLCEFVCFYKNKVLVEYRDWRFHLYDEWRFPQEEVTLSDGQTYLVEERDGEKILKLKQ